MADTDEYVVNAAKSREEWAAEMFTNVDREWVDDDGGLDEAQQVLDESVLAVDKRRGFVVTISTGGPGEWLECTVEEDNEVDKVTFVAAWWSNPVVTRVREGSALWRLAENFNPYQYE